MSLLHKPHPCPLQPTTYACGFAYEWVCVHEFGTNLNIVLCILIKCVRLNVKYLWCAYCCCSCFLILVVAVCCLSVYSFDVSCLMFKMYQVVRSLVRSCCFVMAYWPYDGYKNYNKIHIYVDESDARCLKLCYYCVWNI